MKEKSNKSIGNLNATPGQVVNGAHASACQYEDILVFYPLSLPKNWSQAKDEEHCRGWFGDKEPRPDYYFDLLTKLRWSLRELEEVLNRGCLLYQSRSQLADQEAVGLLDIPRKILFLQQLIVTHAPDERCRRRFAADLKRCGQVLGYRDEIMLRYLRDPQSVWLRELADLDDWVGTAWIWLNDSLGAENKSGAYRSVVHHPPAQDW